MSINASTSKKQPPKKGLQRFGLLVILFSVIQLFSGALLLIFYKPLPAEAWQSLRSLVDRHVYGLFFIKLHSVGAMLVFAMLYFHTADKLFKRSYRYAPLSWMLGVGMLLALLFSATLGHILPMHQQGYWFFTVLRNSFYGLLHAITLDQAGYAPSLVAVEDIPLPFLFILHLLFVPVTIAMMTVFHVSSIFRQDTLKERMKFSIKKYFSSYKRKRYAFVQGVVCVTLLAILARFIPADPVTTSTPDLIVTPEALYPAWYLSAFYAIAKLMPGVLLTILGILGIPGCLIFLPIIDKVKIEKAVNTRKVLLFLCMFGFAGLSLLGKMQNFGRLHHAAGYCCLFLFYGYFTFLWVRSVNDHSRAASS